MFPVPGSFLDNWPPAYLPNVRPAATAPPTRPLNGFGLSSNLSAHEDWIHSSQTVAQGPTDPTMASLPSNNFSFYSKQSRKRKREDFSTAGQNSELAEPVPSTGKPMKLPAETNTLLHQSQVNEDNGINAQNTGAPLSEALQRRLAQVEAQPTWSLLDRLLKLNVIGKALSDCVFNNEASASRYMFLGSSVARYHVSRLLDIKSSFALPHLLTQVRSVVNSSSNVARLWETIGMDVIVSRIKPDVDPQSIRKKSRAEQVLVLLAELDEFATSGPTAARINITRNQDALRGDAANLRDDLISLLLFLGEEDYYSRQVKMGHPKNHYRAIK